MPTIENKDMGSWDMSLNEEMNETFNERYRKMYPPPLFHGPMPCSADDAMEQIVNCFDVSYGTALQCNDAMDLVVGLVKKTDNECALDLDVETSTQPTHWSYQLVVFIW